MSELTGQVAVVTGGSRGIGAAVAALLAERGAAVVVSGRDEGRLKVVVQAMEAQGGSALGVVADAARRENAERLLEAARERFGRLDILVNNAGITRDALLVRMKDDDWDRVMEINLRGAFLMTRAAGRVMMRQRSGRIINIASAAGAMGNAGQANYAASKAGLIGLTKALALEVASRNITVNAVAPGMIDTDMTRAIAAQAHGTWAERIPLKRLGTADEVAAAVAFLASDEASYITGQVLAVNGGMYT
jgi:3-oxoacyl-[acyl-carrier protein] reductase